MQITEITSYSKEQLNEQARNQKLSDNLKKQLKEYFLDLRLQSLLLEELDIKQVSGGDWVVWDTQRDPTNVGGRVALGLLDQLITIDLMTTRVEVLVEQVKMLSLLKHIFAQL